MVFKMVVAKHDKKECVVYHLIKLSVIKLFNVHAAYQLLSVVESHNYEEGR